MTIKEKIENLNRGYNLKQRQTRTKRQDREQITDSERNSPLLEQSFLNGRMLIAMPSMTDQRFSQSVIYLCAHSNQGAMGFVINKTVDHIDFDELLQQFKIESNDVMSPPPILAGGPVDANRGFVLHSDDYYKDESTLCDENGIRLTATVDILKAIARGDGPRTSILALGYAGWAPGQLEEEINANGWLHCDADVNIIFGQNYKKKWDEALTSVGIDLAMLSSEIGHA